MGKNTEFQDALNFVVHASLHKNQTPHKTTTESEKLNRKWKIFYRSSSTIASKQSSKPEQNKHPPEEFICPISGSLMADPVIVSSGHTFERISVQTCQNLNFTPTLPDNSTPDFSTVIPNLALKSAISKWCHTTSNSPPKPPDVASSEKSVHNLMRKTPYWNSEETVSSFPESPPIQLSTRPSCYSSASSSSEIEITFQTSPEEDSIIAKLRSSQVSDIEGAVVSLRKLTKTREDTRAQLCNPRLLSILRSLIVSKCSNIQVNAVAALVNLSLEKVNKVKILRSGIVPLLIEVLKFGSPEVQEHASGAMFSLAIHDDNKTAMGVLGALPPLLNLVNSENERTRSDSALALYHLSMVQSNRVKMVKLGSVHVLMNMLRRGHVRGHVLLILSNLAWCGEGRAALLDAKAVEILVGMLSGAELRTGSTRESCVGVLYGLSQGGLRFKAVARAAGVVEVLKKEEKVGSERAKEKVRRILEIMRVKEEDEDGDDVDWEALLDSGFSTLSHLPES